jgi:hypothetical protein
MLPATKLDDNNRDTELAPGFGISFDQEDALAWRGLSGE